MQLLGRNHVNKKVHVQVHQGGFMRFLRLLSLFLLLPFVVAAQSNQAPNLEKFSLTAQRVDRNIELRGNLSDPLWQSGHYMRLHSTIQSTSMSDSDFTIQIPKRFAQTSPIGTGCMPTILRSPCLTPMGTTSGRMSSSST